MINGAVCYSVTFLTTYSGILPFVVSEQYLIPSLLCNNKVLTCNIQYYSMIIQCLNVFDHASIQFDFTHNIFKRLI